jgi:hypothetical protein
MKKVFFLFLLFFLINFFYSYNSCQAITSRDLLKEGWRIFIKDSDVVALQFFEQALEKAKTEKDTETVADAYLHIGICLYGISSSQGLDYCLKAMAEYKKLEKSNPLKALEGRCKGLQLISTIYFRQGKIREAIALSKEALEGFTNLKDNSRLCWINLSKSWK